MYPRLIVLVMALLSVAARVTAQDLVGRLTVPAAVAPAAAARPANPFRVASFNVQAGRMERSPFTIHPARRVSSPTVLTRVQQKRSKAPIVGGMLLGAVAGFLGGNYVQHSACEGDCGPGAFTWGFTAIGAAGGAGIVLLLR